MLSKNPNFSSSQAIVQSIIAAKNYASTMPVSSVLKLITEVYMHILFEHKLSSHSKTKFPVFYYAYNYVSAQYSVQKLSESKFKTFVETVLAMRREYDSMTSGHDKFSTKVLLFSFFLTGEFKYAPLTRWETEFLDTFLQILSKFDDGLNVINNADPVTEVRFAELSEVILSPEICKLSLENRNNLLHYLVAEPYSRSRRSTCPQTRSTCTTGSSSSQRFFTSGSSSSSSSVSSARSSTTSTSSGRLTTGKRCSSWSAGSSS